MNDLFTFKVFEGTTCRKFGHMQGGIRLNVDTQGS
jgi:hypothetical protein